ncbi:hypothetical protein C1752_08636 [Acaryochloris thomasi RCC1774]|uniref:Uncharacterized protein n=1 Tax=Acaryochloris thomasi RCC1774 TaxID=1764569 RepID=A0A2W1JLA9_9CYAN|nr:hypothetical protein [Acaryochloris thomasi]PZD70984.1 hypothetical protein C1752_08636 [Acaryochloris thomasi RCC1774]
MSQPTDSKQDSVQQPLTPEQISPEKQTQPEADPADLAVNSGDVVNSEKTVEEKAQQVAVNASDITGDREVVPTYFVVDQPDGEQEALHHVKDAEKISDTIRQARVDEEGDRKWR